MDTSVEPVDQANTELVPPAVSSEHAPSTRQSRLSFLYQLWSQILLPLLITRFLLLVVGVVTNYYVLPLINHNQPMFSHTQTPRFPDMLLLMWNRFDSGFYISIARDGYAGANSLHSASNWAFFPLYPLLMRLIALPFGSNQNTYNVVGILLANVAVLIALIYLYKLTTKELNSLAAARAVFYLLLFPMSFYLSAIYPESLFLALSVSSIYYARLQRWWLAGLLGGLAALTRPAGVLLVFGVGWEYWQFLADQYAPMEQTSGVSARAGNWLRSRFIGAWRSLSSWRSWSGVVELALIPAGLLLFLLYAQWKVGNYLAFFTVERVGWNHYFSNPILLVLHMLHHSQRANPYDWEFYSLNIITILAFSFLLVPIFRKLPAIYGIITLAFMLMPLISGKIDSAARYYLTIFPVFMFLAWWSSQGSQERQMWRHNAIVATFAILLSVGMVLFTLGVYSIS